MMELLTSSLACPTPLPRPPEHHHLMKVRDESKSCHIRVEKKIKKESRRNKKELINNNKIYIYIELMLVCELMRIPVYHL